MHVVILCGDLMFVSRLQDAATRAGAETTVVGTQLEAARASGGENVALVVVDLTLPGLDIGKLMQQFAPAKDRAARVLAFAPHVHERSLEQARQAGCDAVVSRGQLHRDADQLVASLLAQA